MKNDYVLKPWLLSGVERWYGIGSADHKQLKSDHKEYNDKSFSNDLPGVLSHG